MCGIAGMALTGGAPVDPAVLEAMGERLAHRGPDDSGTWLRDGGRASLGLAHRRLSIIDLSPLGRQPMASADGGLRVTFNGEIYNFMELRGELQKLGHHFKSRTDTEVLLYAYRAWGLDFVKRLRGMFALALWDEAEQRLVLARDRMGQKPLFYHQDAGGICFSSTLWSLLASPRVPREPDPGAIDLYLTYQYVPTPKSAFAGIAKLPPGHILVWTPQGSRLERYWALDFSRKRRPADLERACGELLEVLGEATRLRMISDVPLGAFLSGGMDSSVVVALMSRLAPEAVGTFSIGFAEQSFNELDYARMQAERWKTDHHEFVVEPHAIEILPGLARMFGEPFADSSAVPTWYVSRETRRHVTVALNGDAGDENFAGYDRYLAFALISRLRPLLRLGARPLLALLRPLPESTARVSKLKRLKRAAQALTLPPGLEYLQFMLHFDQEAKARVLCGDFRRAAAGSDPYGLFERLYASTTGPDPVDRILEADMRSYLLDDLLVKVDVCSMAHALEARSPMLDHKLIEHVAALPSSFKLHGRTGKYLLKEAARGLVPDEIISRPKMGFGVPIGAWFRGQLKDYVRDMLLSTEALSRGVTERAGVERLIDEHQSGRLDHAYRLWSLLMLELWFRQVVGPASRGGA